MKAKNLKNHIAKRSDFISIILSFSHISFVFFPLFLSTYFDSIILTVISFIWVGIFINGIINLMHESAHRLVFKKKIYCDFLGEFILGPLLITDFKAYRNRHWVHHNKLGSEEDTKFIYKKKIKGLNFIIFFFECMSLKEGISKFIYQFSQSNKTKISIDFFVKTISVQAILFSLIFFSQLLVLNQDLKEIFMNTVISYFFVYLYSLASLGVFFSSLRAIAEHQVNNNDEHLHGHAILRNLKSNFLTNLIFGSYGFSDHATHHEYPSIPSYNLKKFRKEIEKNNVDLKPKKGYIEILRDCIV